MHLQSHMPFIIPLMLIVLSYIRMATVFDQPRDVHSGKQSWNFKASVIQSRHMFPLNDPKKYYAFEIVLLDSHVSYAYAFFALVTLMGNSAFNQLDPFMAFFVFWSDTRDKKYRAHAEEI